MAATHAVLGKRPRFFNLDNKIFIQNKIAEILSKEFEQRIIYDPESITNTMQLVYEQQVESIPRMNDRVVRYLVEDFRNQQRNTNKYLAWAEAYSKSQQLYDPIGNKGVDLIPARTINRLGRNKVGSTRGFVFF